MPRRIRNMFDKLLTYENLMKSHILSKRGKGYRKDVILFNLKCEENILELYNLLKEGTYRHSGYTLFYVTDPKLRKIEKSKYIDRIVHRWIVDNFLIPYFVTTFISTSYACLKGRGMHKAVLDVQKTMRNCGYKYILKFDIRKFFESIDKNILYNILCKKIEDKKLISLIHMVIFSNGKQSGLAIGNYTSQIFANIYLNELDRYIKDELKCKWYYRYMDDGIIFCKDKEYAKTILQKISNFLKYRLHLDLNQKTQYFKISQGVNFCGYKIRKDSLLLRNKGKRKLKKKVKYLKYEICEGRMSSKEAKKYLCGHMGYIKYANVEGLINKLFYRGIS